MTEPIGTPRLHGFAGKSKRPRLGFVWPSGVIYGNRSTCILYFRKLSGKSVKIGKDRKVNEKLRMLYEKTLVYSVSGSHNDDRNAFFSIISDFYDVITDFPEMHTVMCIIKLNVLPVPVRFRSGSGK